jgi:hypothetical protein
MRLLATSLLCALAIHAESASGIKWTAPAAWKSQGQRPMRAATYNVVAAAGDKDAGECAVFYFGPGQGGGVQANLDRWQGQFPEKSGAAKIGKQTVAAMTVTTIDLKGTYAWSPSPMSPEKVNKPGYRMLGAIVEAPQGAVFFKFTAQEKTAAGNEAAFWAMIKAISKE